MAAAVNTSAASAGKNMVANGLVVSVGLEKYIGRAQAAVAATRPLLSAMQQLTKTAEELSKATGGAIQIPTGRMTAAHGEMTKVTDRAEGAIDSFSRWSGSTSVLVTRLMTGATVLAWFWKWQNIVSTGSLKAASGFNVLGSAAGTLAGRLSPAVGLTGMFVNAMRMLPFKLGAVGNSALAVGVGFGALSGGIGPLSSGMSLLGLGLRGIPGQFGKIVTAAGASLVTFGLISAAITALTVSITSFAAVAAVMAPALTFGVKLAAEAEQAQISFEVMLGSAEAATTTLGEIRKFAIKTPFGESELISAARALIAFGESASDVVPVLTRIGDVSSGIGAPIGEIAEIYGKARVQGRLFAQDMNQLAGRGIPIFSALAATMGVATEDVKKLVASGSVGFKQLEQAFVFMTRGVKDFGGLTARQAQSLIGQWSTFKDSVSASLRRVGEEFAKAGVLQEAMLTGAGLVSSMEGAMVKLGTVMAWAFGFIVDTANVVKGLAVAAGYVVSAFSGLSGTMQVVIPLLALLAAGLMTVVAAQKAVAVAQVAILALSGPKSWGTIAAASVVVAAGIYGVSKAMNAVEDAAAKAADKLENGIAAQASKIKPVNLIEDQQLGNLEKAQEYIERYRTTAESLAAEQEKIKQAFGGVSAPGAQRSLRGVMDEKTGVYSDIRKMTDELDILTGKATEAEVKVRNLMKAGVPDFVANHAGDLAQRIAEAKSFNDAVEDMKKKAEQREEKRKKDAADKAEQIAKKRADKVDEIRKGIRTPLEALKDELKATRELVGNGGLTAAEAVKHNKKLILAYGERMNDPKTNQAIEANTEAAISAIIAATTQQNPQAKTEDLLKQSLDQEYYQTIALKEVADATNKWIQQKLLLADF